MKKLFLFACALFIVGALSAQNKTVLTVENINCGHCVNNVTQLIGAVDGVEVVKVNIEAKEVSVEFDNEKTTPEKIAEALKGTKYKVVKIDDKEVVVEEDTTPKKETEEDPQPIEN